MRGGSFISWSLLSAAGGLLAAFFLKERFIKFGAKNV